MTDPILIAGPTASGKSALALALARTAPSVIVNADALQVYAGWRVLSARPPAAEEALVPHRLYGHIGMEAAYSTGQWLRQVRAELAAARSAGRRPIIVGGTGLYFAALTGGLAEIPATPPALRAEANDLMATRGLPWFVTTLQREDPETLAQLDAQNPMRVQRAWEVLRLSGRGMAAWHRQTPPPDLPLNMCTALCLRPEVDWLNTRIAKRFDQMLAEGALEEARAALPDWDPARPSSKALGAAELVAVLRGDMTLEAARETAVIATRQYAKRQRTWFRNRMATWQIIDLDDSVDPAGLAQTLR